MKKNKRKTFKFINKKSVAILLVLIAILIVQKSLSKYIIKLQDEHTQESTQFYFESDIADTTKKEYTINNWNGTDTNEIDFYVRNYTNNLLKTEEEILYNMNIVITDENGTEIENGTLINAYVVEKSSGTKISEDNLQNTEFNSNNYTLIIEGVTGGGITSRQIFNVGLSINSTSPYEKQLLANIRLDVTEESPYEINLKESENGEYVTLSIKINKVAGNIAVNFDNTKLILDTSYYLINNTEISSTNGESTFNIPQTSLEVGEIYEINFAKKDQTSQIVLGEDINVQ